MYKALKCWRLCSQLYQARKKGEKEGKARAHGSGDQEIKWSSLI